ncbi:MAG: GDSL-type esterase/lipase family protein [Chitinophagaceae bacterium]
MNKLKLLLFLPLVLTKFLYAQEQKPAFWNDIQKFKKQDSVSFPPGNAILFIGSSSFTMWKDVQDAFPSHKIINRGFGGSSLPDLIRYADEIIFPYHAKQIVIYCGENDVAGSDTITAKTVINRFDILFQIIRKKMPGVPVLFISLKPSPSRWHLKGKMIEINEGIRKYLKKKSNTKFVSVWKAMLGPDGKPMDTLFVEDELHMNARGYAIWKKLIGPHLLN